MLQRELISFAALASVANQESGLRPVLLAYADLLVRKAAERGLQMNKDQLANAALDDVEAMISQPFKWAQRWLSEFGDTRKIITSYLPSIAACLPRFSHLTAMVGGPRKRYPRRRRRCALRLGAAEPGHAN